MKYSAEQVDDMVNTYKDVMNNDYVDRSKVVDNLAKKHNTSSASVRAVLVRAEVYKKKEDTEPSKAAFSKVELVAAFAAVVGKDMPSLSNASRKDLQALWDYIVSASDAKAVK